MEKHTRDSIRNTLIFVAFVAFVLGFLFSISGERSNRIPDNEKHSNLSSVEFCMGCHGPDREFARGPEHPPKDDCFLCHKTKRNRKFK
jgi:cytochrome c553